MTGSANDKSAAELAVHREEDDAACLAPLGLEAASSALGSTIPTRRRKPAVPSRTPRPSTLPRTPRPGGAAKPETKAAAVTALACSLQDRRGERVLAAALEARRERERARVSSTPGSGATRTSAAGLR